MERKEILDGEHRHIFRVLSSILATANSWATPDCTRPTPSTGDIPSKTLWIPHALAYTGYFLHIGTTENEINELGVDTEILSPSERRICRLRHDESKWDLEYYSTCTSRCPSDVKK